MSGRLMERIMDQQLDVSLAEFKVLMVLARNADDDGTNAYPSLETIAVKTRSHRQGVMRCLKSLIAKGIVTKARPGGGRCRTTSYSITTVPITGGNGTTTSPRLYPRL